MKIPSEKYIALLFTYYCLLKRGQSGGGKNCPINFNILFTNLYGIL